MANMVVCAECKTKFQEDVRYYGGSEFCPSCREPHSDAAVNARKESYVQFRRKDMSEGDADRASMHVARDVIRNRADQRRERNG